MQRLGSCDVLQQKCLGTALCSCLCMRLARSSNLIGTTLVPGTILTMVIMMTTMHKLAEASHAAIRYRMQALEDAIISGSIMLSGQESASGQHAVVQRVRHVHHPMIDETAEVDWTCLRPHDSNQRANLDVTRSGWLSNDTRASILRQALVNCEAEIWSFW